MTRFRPCIDLHAGQVKQIVGGTLDSKTSELQTNFVSPHSPAHFARLYRKYALAGAHVIMLGPGNGDATRESLDAWPGGLQVGGGINKDNAKGWIEAGAQSVIITSYLFPNGTFSQPRLDAVLDALDGDKAKLVIDLSCRRHGGEERWFVAMNKWQTITDMEVNQKSIRLLEPYCSEFLIHAADNEGLQRGIDEALVTKLAQWCSIPVTYAGGGRNLADLDRVKELSGGKVDLTIGSALDCFGGKGVKLVECVAWNRLQEREERKKEALKSAWVLLFLLSLPLLLMVAYSLWKDGYEVYCLQAVKTWESQKIKFWDAWEKWTEKWTI